MKRAALETLAGTLRKQRAILFKEVVDTESDLQFIAQERETEIEERAQQERLARLFDRLDLRGKREIELIDRALQRIADGRFGVCMSCKKTIPEARLRALPATPYCVKCAGKVEAPAPPGASAEEGLEAGSAEVAADLTLLSDVELRQAIADAIEADGRVDVEELRILCRHGIVILDGTVPSAAEHQLLRKLITDVVGVRDLRDQLRVNEMLWERDDRDRHSYPPETPSRLYDPPASEDVVETLEEGTEYNAPSAPPADEEEESSR